MREIVKVARLIVTDFMQFLSIGQIRVYKNCSVKLRIPVDLLPQKFLSFRLVCSLLTGAGNEA